MTNSTANQYTFTIGFPTHSIDVIIESTSPVSASRYIFDNADKDVAAGWRSIVPHFDPQLAPTITLNRMALVSAAQRRALVMTTEGRLGRLVRWDTPKRPNTARIEFSKGNAVTMKCARVVFVDYDPVKVIKEGTKQ